MSVCPSVVDVEREKFVCADNSTIPRIVMTKTGGRSGRGGQRGRSGSRGGRAGRGRGRSNKEKPSIDSSLPASAVPFEPSASQSSDTVTSNKNGKKPRDDRKKDIGTKYQSETKKHTGNKKESAIKKDSGTNESLEQEKDTGKSVKQVDKQRKKKGPTQTEREID